MFVYKYFTGHLLSLAQKDMPLVLTKRILKDTLRGLAALHDQHIVHAGNYAFSVYGIPGWLLMHCRCQGEQYFGRVERRSSRSIY